MLEPGDCVRIHSVLPLAAPGDADADAAAAAAAAVPGPPWRCRVDALLWWHRATPAARGALPAGLAGGRLVPVTTGAWLRYHDSPVGGYDEILGAPALVPSVPSLVPLRQVPLLHVPFIAVDSPVSVAAGRAHWVLPKVLAQFGAAGPGGGDGPGGDGPGGGDAGLRVAGDGWRIAGRVTARGPRLPFRLRVGTVQQAPDGTLTRTALRLVGSGRAARIRLVVRGPAALADWFRGGRHRAVLVTDGRLTVSPSRRP